MSRENSQCDWNPQKTYWIHSSGIANMKRLPLWCVVFDVRHLLVSLDLFLFFTLLCKQWRIHLDSADKGAFLLVFWRSLSSCSIVMVCLCLWYLPFYKYKNIRQQVPHRTWEGFVPFAVLMHAICAMARNSLMFCYIWKWK